MESDLLVAFKAKFDAIWPLVSLKKHWLPGALPLDPTWGAYNASQEPPLLLLLLFIIIIIIDLFQFGL